MRSHAVNKYQVVITGLIAFLCVLTGCVSHGDETLLGEWILLFDDEGELDAIKLDFVIENGDVVGTFSSELGDHPISNLAFSEGDLTFTVHAPELAITVDFKGIVQGDAIKGMLHSFAGNIQASGKRTPRDIARIVIEPNSPVVLGDPVSVTVANLSPNERVRLIGESVDSNGTLWRSEAVFQASDAGVVDPAVQAPLAGTYQGADPHGIFWSMKETDEQPMDWPEESARESLIRFEAMINDEVAASAWHKRWLVAPGVKVEEIRRPGFVATFYAPDSDAPAPCVIVLGGSEGGIPTMRAGLLASRGYAALALAYWRVEGLSQRFGDLPLEMVENAIQWLERSPLADATEIAIVGPSKGAELALLSAARFSKIKAVAAFAPTHVVWQGIFVQGSSWSYRGEPLPFVPYGESLEFGRTGHLIYLYEAGLAQAGWPSEARIPVENIQGPILLVSGRKDAMWNSAGMADEVIARLKKNDHPFEYRHVVYDEAGHHVTGPGYRRYEVTARSGGASQASAHAQAESWGLLLEFLNKHLHLNSE